MGKRNDRLSRYEGEPGVVIAYGSMYGHTEQMAEEIARELAANGIKEIVLHNVSHEDPSYILQNIFRYRGLIIGSPTYSNRLFPAVETLTESHVCLFRFFHLGRCGSKTPRRIRRIHEMGNYPLLYRNETKHYSGYKGAM